MLRATSHAASYLATNRRISATLFFALTASLPPIANSPVLAQAPAACEPAVHGASLHRQTPWTIEGYGRQAAGAVLQGFQAQAQNGAAIEMTL